MAQLFSHSHLEHIIDGHRVTRMADEERPIEFSDGSDLLEIKRGKDGGMYGVSNAMFGGPVTYRMDPASPTTQFFIKLRQEQKENERTGRIQRILRATHVDTSQGRSCVCEGGMLQKCPDMSEPGVTFEAMVEYERIVSNVDGAIFQPLLETG